MEPTPIKAPDEPLSTKKLVDYPIDKESSGLVEDYPLMIHLSDVKGYLKKKSGE